MSVSRRAVLGALGAAAVAVTRACDDDTPEHDGVVGVHGDFGTSPRVEFDAPLVFSEPYTEEILHGQGVELHEDSAVMLSYLAINARTGETIESNFQESPDIMVLSEETAGVLYEELIGRTEGTRILRVEAGTLQRPDPTVLVYDIRRTQAWGQEVEIPDEAPEVRVDEDGTPVVIVPEHDPPADLQVVPVLRGDGPQVRAGQAVTVRYSTVSWSTGEVADTLWGDGLMPTTIPFTGLIPAWQNGLVDEQVGSRVMLITPPEQAFGTDNLVFIIDVLAVSSTDDAQEPEGEDGATSDESGSDEAGTDDSGTGDSGTDDPDSGDERGDEDEQ